VHVLFPRWQWPGVEDGSITVAFRRWKRPTVKAGGNLRSPGGYLAIDGVDPIGQGEITGEDLAASGYDSLDALLADLGPPEPGRTLYRIRFRVEGDDPRTELRNRAEITPEERGALFDRLARLDRAAETPWTARVLDAIAQGPGRSSRHLAVDLELPRPELKQRIRKLKALGLTESLEVGYRISPRGRTALDLLQDA
jgi:hypothetical protein